jgi:hypothetical protein
MELGDGQVSGLPDRLDVEIFYKNLFNSLNADTALVFE